MTVWIQFVTGEEEGVSMLEEQDAEALIRALSQPNTLVLLPKPYQAEHRDYVATSQIRTVQVRPDQESVANTGRQVYR